MVGQHSTFIHVRVTAQINFSLERPSATVARKRLISAVLPTVGDEVGRLAKCLAAHTTDIRLLSCDTQSKKISFELRTQIIESSIQLDAKSDCIKLLKLYHMHILVIKCGKLC